MSKLLNSARMYLRNIDLAFGYMASFPLKKTESDRYVLSWSVIRYLDCIIDSSATICSKQTALNRYMEITDDYILNGKLPNIETEVDSFMTEYLKLEKISTIKTIDCFRNILNSFKMDISRHDKILSWDEYDDYLIYRSDSVLELYYRLLFQRIDPWVKKLAHHYARLFQYVDDVLDFFDDIEIGQINITKNEMQKIGLSNIADIKTEKIELFYNMRKELIANHFLAFIEMLVEKSDLPYSLRRYLEESIGYNITPIIKNNFHPGTKLLLPYESIIKTITNHKHQTKLYKILHNVVFIYSLPHWYVNVNVIKICKLLSKEYCGFL